MKLPLAYFGDPVLRKKTAPVEDINDTIRQLIIDMTETMEANDGCGLAAPQVHQSLALFITCIPRYVDDDTVLPGKLKVFINPKIVAYSPETWECQEGCLSIPGIRETVSRPLKVTIQATDLEGNPFIEEFVGFDAHVVMHENDHINGVLYIDRLPPRRKKELEQHLKAIKKKYSKN
ncbi:polypeptide deformylase [Candidatus Protochlamydia naegleriophila]|uniref:Peptide deformylase n=1 Tax=Candidatus Protochlamydia naegleriophila TaxID=389348 RepID=A0A0U5J9V9_9BACT|nr:peptide deformylase [Candidatus Protochlamydia naegleriophila]CUI16584.1 polypeptide deformylase [Candidatus Protochlamydia naegleriophila]